MGTALYWLTIEIFDNKCRIYRRTQICAPEGLVRMWRRAERYCAEFFLSSTNHRCTNWCNRQNPAASSQPPQRPRPREPRGPEVFSDPFGQIYSQDRDDPRVNSILPGISPGVFRAFIRAVRELISHGRNSRVSHSCHRTSSHMMSLRLPFCSFMLN